MNRPDDYAYELLHITDHTMRGLCHRCGRKSHYETRPEKCAKWFDKHKCSVTLENSKQQVWFVHDDRQCLGDTCTIHRRSDHHMRSWQQHFRHDRYLMERICPIHGVGHPDPDDINPDTVHGCCGCCAKEQ